MKDLVERRLAGDGGKVDAGVAAGDGAARDWKIGDVAADDLFVVDGIRLPEVEEPSLRREPSDLAADQGADLAGSPGDQQSVHGTTIVQPA
jgi:hypothetical protein